MVTKHADTASKATLHCSYDTTYYSMYQPSYDMIFIFYDEDESNEYQNGAWGNAITPVSHDSGIQH